jgi:hypothetical protein
MSVSTSGDESGATARNRPVVRAPSAAARIDDSHPTAVPHHAEHRVGTGERRDPLDGLSAYLSRRARGLAPAPDAAGPRDVTARHRPGARFADPDPEFAGKPALTSAHESASGRWLADAVPAIP